MYCIYRYWDIEGLCCCLMIQLKRKRKKKPSWFWSQVKHTSHGKSLCVTFIKFHCFSPTLYLTSSQHDVLFKCPPFGGLLPLETSPLKSKKKKKLSAEKIISHVCFKWAGLTSLPFESQLLHLHFPSTSYRDI